MQITVCFNNLDEVREFTESILVGGSLTQTCESVQQVPEAPVQQTSAVPVQQAPVAPAQQAPVAPVQQAPAALTQQVPTSNVTYGPDDLARAAMALMDSGKQQELIALLGQFGVVSIPELRQEQYGTFATALRGMGAQI